MTASRYWLGLWWTLGTVAMAGPIPPRTPAGPSSAPESQSPQSQSPQSQSIESPPPDDSDDEFIEFLGADDVGDAAWWEFLKKAAPRKELPVPAPPSQDAAQ